MPQTPKGFIPDSALPKGFIPDDSSKTIVTNYKPKTDEDLEWDERKKLGRTDPYAYKRTYGEPYQEDESGNVIHAEGYGGNKNFIERQMTNIHEMGMDTPENLALAALTSGGSGVSAAGLHAAEKATPYIGKSLRYGQMGIGAGMVGQGLLGASKTDDPKEKGMAYGNAALGALGLAGGYLSGRAKAPAGERAVFDRTKKLNSTAEANLQARGYYTGDKPGSTPFDRYKLIGEGKDAFIQALDNQGEMPTRLPDVGSAENLPHRPGPFDNARMVNGKLKFKDDATPEPNVGANTYMKAGQRTSTPFDNYKPSDSGPVEPLDTPRQAPVQLPNEDVVPPRSSNPFDRYKPSAPGEPLQEIGDVAPPVQQQAAKPKPLSMRVSNPTPEQHEQLLNEGYTPIEQDSGGHVKYALSVEPLDKPKISQQMHGPEQELIPTTVRVMNPSEAKIADLSAKGYKLGQTLNDGSSIFTLGSVGEEAGSGGAMPGMGNTEMPEVAPIPKVDPNKAILDKLINKNLSRVSLIRPTEEQLQYASEQGFEPISMNKDGSVSLKRVRLPKMPDVEGQFNDSVIKEAAKDLPVPEDIQAKQQAMIERARANGFNGKINEPLPPVTEFETAQESLFGDKKPQKFHEEEEPQFARHEGGVKIGADVRSLGKVLGSSLYAGDISKIAAKELMQNSFDAVRPLGNKGKIDLTFNSDKHFVEVKDNGKGLTRQELETVFTDLGSSGKRDDATAIGGFGLAKAAPLLGGERVEVTTITNENGKLLQHKFSGTPDELLDGVQIETTIAPQGSTTGTTVRTYVPKGSYFYSARTFTEKMIANSPNMKGKVSIHNADAGGSYADHYEPGNVTNNANVQTIKGSSADVELIVPEGTEYGPTNGVNYEILNNGMYQNSGRMGYQEVPGVPKKLLINIKSKVAEGHHDYPFTANRETLRGSTLEIVEKYLQDNIVKPAVGKRMDQLNKVYQGMPEMTIPAIGAKKFFLYDVNQKLTPEELKFIQHDPVVIDLATHISDTIHHALEVIDEPAWNERLQKIGFIFDDKLKGIHIPSPVDGKSAILINPFSMIASLEPEQASAGILHTILHEIAHIPGGGHDESFTVRLSQIYEKYGARNAVKAQDRILESISNDGNNYNDSIHEVLQRYEESRRRIETTHDPLYGTGIGSKAKPGGTPENDRYARSGRTRVINNLTKQATESLYGSKNTPSMPEVKPLGQRGSDMTRVEPLKKESNIKLLHAGPYIDTAKFIEAAKKLKGAELVDKLNVLRTIRSSFDASALRQGIGFMGKTAYWKNVVPMIKAMANPEIAKQLDADMKASPAYRWARKAGVAFTEWQGHNPVNKEEGFQSNWAEDFIPGVRMSERGYTTYLNKLRLDVFGDLHNTFTDGGKNPLTPKELEQLGTYVNNFSGRGSFGTGKNAKAFEAASPFISGLIFSPRLAASRVQMLNPMYYAKLAKTNPKLFMEATKSMGKLAAITGSVIAAAKAMGYDVGSDPASSDFGKIIAGKTRIDLFGGLQQYAVLAYRVRYHKYTNSVSGKQTDLTSGKFGMKDVGEVIGDFMVNKFSPNAALAWHGITRKGADNLPIDAKKEGQGLLPMTMQDGWKLMHDNPDQAALMIPALFGVGVNVYNDDGAYKPKSKPVGSRFRGTGDRFRK